jgi:hypothetical protein
MNTENRFVVLLSMTATLLLLAACGTPQPTATEPPIAMDTTARTDTPEPADTPLPTDTPIPTEPPAPPTETPEPEPEALTWPTKRHWHTMAYDPQIDRVLLFCGLTGRTGGYYDPEEKRLNAGDEWAYDVVQNRLEILGTSPYAFSNMAVYDTQSGQLIGFGLEDTVVYDMETRAWQKLEPAEQPPTYRFGYALAYDSQSDRIILFGGWNHLDDTWAYDYETNTWTEMTPDASPPAREYHAMAYDAESDRIILWGEELSSPTDFEAESAMIWVYDYETNTWEAIEYSGGPSYRGGHSMVYHPGTDRIILFGGHSGGVDFSDETWAYDYNTNTWTQLEPTNHPSARRYHTMVYAEAADKMVLFGGITGNWLREEVNDELWVFDPVAEEWSQVTPDSLNP